MTEFFLVWSSAGSCSEFKSEIVLLCPEEKGHPSFLWLLPTFLWYSQNLGGRGWYRCCVWGWVLNIFFWHSSPAESLHWLFIAHCKKKIPGSRLSITQFYWCKRKYLENHLTAWPFSKITITCSTLEPMASSAMSFDKDYSPRHVTLSCGAGLKSN